MPSKETKNIVDRASQCVRCGLCLPHCPTYQLAKEEPESPRGRIQMLAALAKQELEWQPSLQQHVDQCLACGHCERVCPIPVDYHDLIINGRKLLAENHSVSLLKRVAIKIIETPQLRKIFYVLLKVLSRIIPTRASAYFQTANLDSRLRGNDILTATPEVLRCAQNDTICQNDACAVIPAKAGIHCHSKKDSAIPKICHSERSEESPDNNSQKTKILLFPGCTGENFGHSTFTATKNILQQLGYEVVLPPSSFCCGALSAHAGLGLTTAESTAEKIINFCERLNIKTLITFATGCGGFLVQQNILQPLEVLDIQQFLLLYKEKWISAFAEMTAPQKKLRVAVHAPCTQTNALRQPNLSYELLSKIPGLELLRFGEKSCCGAAGLYMLEHKKISEQLVQQLLTDNLLNQCDVITTSNIGCQLQFQRYLQQRNYFHIKVMHPIEVLESF